MKQTAVEWLVEQMKINNYISDNAHWLIDDAKEMEKQQQGYSEEDIALAFNEGQAYSVRGKLVDGKEWVKEHKKEWFESFKNK